MPQEHAHLLPDEEGTPQANISRSSTASGPTPLPWRALFALLLLTAIQPLAFEIIFPFVNQMILEIGVVTDLEQVGFYSGLIESIFSCMSFITIMPASYLADRIGRKPVILGGITGLAVSIASFGMSKSFLAMVLSRCIGGALGGAWACSKIMVGELTDRSNQAVAFQWLSIAYRIGQIIGLPLGGLLAHPAHNFLIFQTRFWYEYPFALPCFVGSIIAVCSVVMGYFTLHETLRSKMALTRISTYGTMSAPTDSESVTAWGASAPTENIDESIDTPSVKSILTPSITSLLASNLVMCLASESLFSLFPLFAFTPIVSGGLGMSEAAIGTHMAIRAVLHVGTGAIYAPLEKYFGSTLRFYRVIMWALPLTVLCLPLLNAMARRGEEGTWFFNGALLVFYVIWAGSGLAWTSIAIMITEAAPSPGALATINGLSQMAIVLPEAIAPAFVTSLFAFSIQKEIAGGNLTWIVLFIFTCTAAFHSMTLREPKSGWRNENQHS